MHYFVKAIE